MPDEDDERHHHGLAMSRGMSLCYRKTTTVLRIKGIHVQIQRERYPRQRSISLGAAQGQRNPEA